MKKKTLLSALGIVSAFALASCVGGGDNNQSTTPQTTPTTTESTTESSTTKALSKFTVTLII